MSLSYRYSFSVPASVFTSRMLGRQQEPEYSTSGIRGPCEKTRVKKLLEKGEMRKIPKVTIMSKYVSNVKTYKARKTMSIASSRLVEMVEVTSCVQEKMDVKDKEDRNNEVV